MMRRPPWEGEWLRVSPEQFEKMVVAYLRELGQALAGFDVTHRTPLQTQDGEFEIDAVATFEALGASFVVLVECKHHRNPIKREVVQVLADKLTASRSQKGILFSTAPFQRGAIEFAVARQIALVHFTEGGPVYETKSAGPPTGPRRPYDAYFVTVNETGAITYSYGAFADVAALVLSK